MGKWLKDCEVCNAGLCSEFDSLIANGMSQRKAAKHLETEQISILGEVIHRASTLRRRYLRNKPPQKVVTNVTKKQKTYAKEDIIELINNGKKFSTIYANPPWQSAKQASLPSTKKKYSLGVNDIAKLPIPELTTENAHLHLWTSDAFWDDAITIMKAWGFEYKSYFIWVKPQKGRGYYWGESHGFLLLGVKGKLAFLDRKQKNWAEYKKLKNNKKPEEIVKNIELVSPAPYLDLFGNMIRTGWTVCGNNIKRDIMYLDAFKD